MDSLILPTITIDQLKSLLEKSHQSRMCVFELNEILSTKIHIEYENIPYMSVNRVVEMCEELLPQC